MFGVEFRPLTFDSVYGLSVVKSILKKILKSNNFDPGYLFEGSFSSGKTTLGRIFARSAFCQNRKEDMSPCNVCPSCIAFLEGRHPGYLEIDAANNGSKDRIQDLKESFKFESFVDKKFILFDEAHNISKEGKDALLIQLEIPNSNVIMIFCTTEIEKMPESLLSRCMDFQLPEPMEKDVIQKLTEICEVKSFEYDKEALYTLVRSSGRHFRDAENKLRQISLLGPINKENVKKVVTLYDEEIVRMLVSIPKDLSESIRIADYLISKMSIKRIYVSILRLLNDSIKGLSGISFDSAGYSAILDVLKNQYGNILFEMLDYLINKSRLNDLTFFQSDLLILHYKFMKGGFKFKAFEVPADRGVQIKDKRDAQGSREIIDSKSLEPWEREDKLREIKMQRMKDNKNEKVPERVSTKWGPEVKENIPAQPSKAKLSPEQFSQIIGGSTEPEKI